VVNKRFLIALVACMVAPHLAAKPTKSRVEAEAKKTIESLVKREKLSNYKVKNALRSEYNDAIRNITNILTRFFEKIETLVFRSDLSLSIKTAVNKKLRPYGLSANSIPSSLSWDYNRKIDANTRAPKNKMWVKSTDCVTKKEVQKEVDTEIDYYFVQKIKSKLNESAWDFSDIWNEKPKPSSSSSSSSTKVYLDETCSICLDEYQTDERIGVLSCGHAFHSSCIKEWFKSLTAAGKKKTCPLCRKQNVIIKSIYNTKEEVPGYKPKEKVYLDKTCSICLDEYQTDERIGVLSCGHAFHSSCIKEWFKSLTDAGKKKTCPLCRKQNVIIKSIYNSKEEVPGYRIKSDYGKK